MPMYAAAYHEALSALLPPGLPWPREPGTRLQALLAAWADTLARIDARADVLTEEADPRSTIEMLEDWERAYGLPDPCYDTAQTATARRAEIVGRMLNTGGQRPADYLALAAALGYDATLTEYRPHTVDSPCDAPLLDPAWAHAWTLTIDLAVEPVHWPVTGRVSEPLASWAGADALVCLLRRRKPAHTTLLVAYEDM